MPKATHYRVFENGQSRVGHFNAFHYKEATGVAPCVKPGRWDEPYEIARDTALELINRWNRTTQYTSSNFSRVFVLEP